MFLKKITLFLSILYFGALSVNAQDKEKTPVEAELVWQAFMQQERTNEELFDILSFDSFAQYREFASHELIYRNLNLDELIKIFGSNSSDRPSVFSRILTMTGPTKLGDVLFDIKRQEQYAHEVATEIFDKYPLLDNLDGIVQWENHQICREKAAILILESKDASPMHIVHILYEWVELPETVKELAWERLMKMKSHPKFKLALKDMIYYGGDKFRQEIEELLWPRVDKSFDPFQIPDEKLIGLMKTTLN